MESEKLVKEVVDEQESEIDVKEYIKEIQSLISMREYINILVNNYNRSKSEIADLRAMYVLIDNKAIDMLLSKEFKKYINFEDAKKAIARAAELNNIKSGLPKGR